MNRRPIALLSCLLALGCQSEPAAVPTTTADGAGPVVDARAEHSRIKEARFQAAIDGLAFESGRVVVTDPVAVTSREAAERHLAVGMERLLTNEKTEASGAFTTALRNDPSWPDAYAALGRAMIAKGRLDLALAAYRTATDLTPADAALNYEVAMILDRMGRRTEAIEQMQAVVALDAAHGAAHERLAIWSYYQDDLDAARQHADAARALGYPLPPQFTALLGAQGG